ncbi:MAG: hypothetical protein DBX61_02895 [Clostridiales bacterium]|nr:MAG: hypothetical protein DBX61_02895 [Clostridiales bacterium]
MIFINTALLVAALFAALLCGKNIVFPPLFLKKRAGFGVEPHKNGVWGRATSYIIQDICNILTIFYKHIPMFQQMLV